MNTPAGLACAAYAFALALTLCFGGVPVRARAADSAPVVITAQQVALYADRGILLAQGGVSVHGAGLQLTATRVAYDLRANRLTAAGDVTVRSGAAPGNVAGYVYDFAAKNGRVDPNAAVPQLSTADASAVGQQVELRPGGSIVFTNAQVLTGSTLIPVASYAYTIPPPSAKDFGYSPVPSAALEWAVPVGVSRNDYTFARARFDRYNGGLGTGLEEHYARTGRGYVALGATLDMNGARFDMAAYERINDSLSQSLTSTYLFGTHTWRYALSSTGKYGFASLSSTQYNASRSDDFFLAGNQHPIGKVASFHLQADLGHDVHPSDRDVADDLRLTPGVHIDTAAVHIRNASITASGDVGESIYSYGRGTLSSGASLWATLPQSSRLLWTAGASFSHNAPPFPSSTRTYTLGATWRAGDRFNLVSSIAYNHDYGQSPGNGRPEFVAAFDVRVRRKNGTGIEVGTLLPFGHVGNMNKQAVLNFRFFK
ncbi:MAG TPA: hypothetical protein VFE17_05760 [Candidatus Baltobacteraceae bacterium]|nr:hypothetical protein [Candidatus Baltobacteraceae bacterium]